MHRRDRIIRLIPLGVCIIATVFAQHARAMSHAAAPDWNAFSEVDTVYVLTTDDDGDTRETKIWIAVIAGVPYVRTSQGSTWGDNVERDADIALRVDGTDYAVRATFVTDEDDRAHIIAGFEEKYGSNPILNWIRGDDPRIMRLESR